MTTATSLEELEALASGEATEAEVNATAEPTDREKQLSDQGKRLQEARKAKMDGYFGGGRQYEIKKFVELPKDAEKLETPFGNKILKGYGMVQVAGPKPENWEEVEGDRAVKFFLGESVLREANGTYGAVTNFEEHLKAKRKRMTKVEKAEAEQAHKETQRKLVDDLFASFESDTASA